MSQRKEDLTELLEHELYGARMMIERVPENQFDWKPHEKSFTLIGLASHVANLLYWMTTIAREDSFDVGANPNSASMPENRQELIDLFDANADQLYVALDNINDTDLGDNWQLMHGDNVLIDEPRISVFYKMGLNHLIHHRGQLSVYLRMLDVPVPPTYGPTADEQATF